MYNTISFKSILIFMSWFLKKNCSLQKKQAYFRNYFRTKSLNKMESRCPICLKICTSDIRALLAMYAMLYIGHIRGGAKAFKSTGWALWAHSEVLRVLINFAEILLNILDILEFLDILDILDIFDIQHVSRPTAGTCQGASLRRPYLLDLSTVESTHRKI